MHDMLLERNIMIFRAIKLSMFEITVITSEYFELINMVLTFVFELTI
jgi:hypothetical protein